MYVYTKKYLIIIFEYKFMYCHLKPAAAQVNVVLIYHYCYEYKLTSYE